MSIGGIHKETGYITTSKLISLIKQIDELKATIVNAVKNGKIVVDHSELSSIGVKTHAQIDTHIADNDIHTSISELIVQQSATPALTDDGPWFWMYDGATPWQGAMRVKDTGGTYRWAQFVKKI